MRTPGAARPRISQLGAHTFKTKLSVQALGLVASILIARALGPEGRGRYYIPVTLATVALYLGNAGTERAQFRAWSRQEATPKGLVSAGVWLSGVLGIVVVGIGWAAFVLGSDSLFAGVQSVDVLMVLGTLPFQIHVYLLYGLFIAAGYLPLTNQAALAAAACQTAGIVGLVASGAASVETVLAFYVVSVTVPWLVMFPAALRLGGGLGTPPWALMRRLLSVGLQLEPYLLFTYLLLRADVFFVARYMSLADVGLYSVALTFAEVVWLATDSIVYSIIERQANAREAEATDVTLRAVRMNLLIGALLAMGLAAAAPIGVRIVYGDEFGRATSAILALLPASIAMGLWRPIGSLMLRLSRPWVQPVVALSALTINALGDVILIPRLGLVGAGLASTLSYATGAATALVWLVACRRASPAQLVPDSHDAKQLVAALRQSTLLTGVVRTR